MKRSPLLTTWAALLAASTAGWLTPGPAWTAEEAPAAFTLTPDEHGMVLKAPDGKTVFRYMTRKPAKTNLSANSVCCLYPVNTPSGVRAVDFAPGDHRHHRGISSPGMPRPVAGRGPISGVGVPGRRPRTG